MWKRTLTSAKSGGMQLRIGNSFSSMHPISYRSFTFALAEETSSFTDTVLDPSNARSGDHVLIKPASDKEAWFWGVWTAEIAPGSDEWKYKRIERLDLVTYIEKDIKDHEFKISACTYPDTLAR